MRKTTLFVMAALAVVLAACGPRELVARDAWARPAIQGGTGAVYVELYNGTGQPISLIGASTNVARVVEIHTSSMMDMSEGSEHGAHPTTDAEADVAMMMPVDVVELEVGLTVAFEPGGYHLMLIDLQQPLQAGDTFSLTLHFEGHADIEIEVSVRE